MTQIPFLSATAACALILQTGQAMSQEACKVRVVGDGSAEWEQAAQTASNDMGEGDCADVLVEVRGQQARVRFTTRDGRNAERVLVHPSDLQATIEALQVTVPVEQVAGDASPPQETLVVAGKQKAESPVQDRGANAVSPRSSQRSTVSQEAITWAAQAGVRGGASFLASPVVEGFVLLPRGTWELGVQGRYEMRYQGLGEEASPLTSGFAAGIVVGVRHPVARQLAVLTGGSLSIAALHRDSPEGQDNEGMQGRAEPRVGGYLGLVLPRQSSSRFRSHLAVEFVPNHLGQSEEDAAGLPVLPWWAVSLALGMEVSGP